MKGDGGFWVLQWEDGSFFRVGHQHTVEGTNDLLEAHRFDSAESAKHHHDGAGHFYGQPMKAVRVVAIVDDASTLELPALERSIWADDD